MVEYVYYLEEDTNEWILIESDETEDKLACFVAANKTEQTETVKTYKIEI